MRLAAAAFPLRALTATAWVAAVEERCVRAAAAGARLLLLPEYVTAGLLRHADDWAAWTTLWQDTAHDAARRHGLFLGAGTHLVRTPEGLRNRLLLVAPDGTAWQQDKLHPTPWEAGWGLPATAALTVRVWAGSGATTGDATGASAGCAIAAAICYDVEFPELCRSAAQAGAQILLVPSWTDDAAGFYRVRRCASARCVENALAVLHAPLVGGRPELPDFEAAVGAPAILVPSDEGFPADGLLAGSHRPGDAEALAIADLDLAALAHLRSGGTVSPLRDARPATAYRITP